MLSVYGAGYIGGRYCEMYPNETLIIPREQRNPETQEILYFISTIDNSNIHTDITLDVKTNLSILCEVLDYCRSADCVSILFLLGSFMETVNFLLKKILLAIQEVFILSQRSCRRSTR